MRREKKYELIRCVTGLHAPYPYKRRTPEQYPDSKSTHKSVEGKKLETHQLTSSMAPAAPSIPRPHWRSTGNALATTVSASGLGLALRVNTNTGGLSCAMRIAARDSHAAVSCLSAAMQTNSRRGPAGREMRVMSPGRQVIDLKRSLNAYLVAFR